MANRINRKRLLSVLIGLCLFAAFSAGLYAYRLHRMSRAFMAMRAQGLQAAASGAPETAVNVLGEYLARYPNDVEILHVYAQNCQLVEQPGNEQFGRAIWALRHLLRLEPNHLDARREVMDLYAKTGYHAEALDSANTILETRIRAAADQEMASELAAIGIGDNSSRAHASDQEMAAVRPKLVHVLSQNSDAVDAISVRTTSLLRLRNYPEALTACNWWIDAAPDDLEPALERVELLQDNHRPQQEAKDLADKWVKNHAIAADNDLLLGHTDLVYGVMKEAGDCLIRAAAGNPASPVATRILISDLDYVHQLELSRDVLGRLLSKKPNDDAIRYELIARDWESGHLSEVLELCGNVAALHEPPTFVLGLRSAAILMQGKPTEALGALQPLIDRKDDREAAAWVVVIRQAVDHASDAQHAIDACLLGLDQNARDYYLRHFLAEAYLQTGERDLAAREWQRVIGENHTWVVPCIRLSAVLLDQGRTEAAAQVGSEAYSRAPGSLDAAVVLAEGWTANIQAGRTDGSDQCLRLVSLLCEQAPHDGRPVVLKGNLLAALGRLPEATAVVQQAIDSNESLPEACWIRLASLSESRHMQLELKCLARSQKEHGITATLAYSKAVAIGDAQKGLASFDADAEAATHQLPATAPTADAAAKNGAAEHAPEMAITWDLARAGYLELTHDEHAAQAWARLADQNPDRPRVQQLVLSVQSARADKTLSARCIDRIGKISGVKGAIWRSARARWLVAFGEFFDQKNQAAPDALEARKLLDELVRQSPDSAEIHLLSAQAFDRARKVPDAINELRIASNLNPGAPSIRLYLARLLADIGDFEAVREQCEHFTDAELQDTDQRQQAAGLLAQQGQTDRAVALLEEDARKGAESETAKLLLAQIYQRRNELPKADALLHELLAAPQPSAAALRFGAILLASEHKMDEARKVLDRLGNDPHAQPGVAELIRADFARQYESDAGPDKAISLFEKATQVAPQNAFTWRALTAANLLIGRPNQALAAANAGLIVIPNDPTLKAISQQPGMLTDAAKNPELQPMLLYFVNDPSSGSAAASALGAIYAASESNQTSNELLVRLRELAEQYPRFDALQVYLVHQYEKVGRYDDAIAVATHAAQVRPDSAPVAGAITEALMLASHWPEALAAANRWRQNVPTDITPATLAMSEALLKLRRPTEAVNLLVPLVNAPGQQPNGDILAKYIEAQRASGIEPNMAALMQPLLDLGATGRRQWMQFAVSGTLPPVEAEAWLKRVEVKMPRANTRPGVLEHVLLSEMYSSLAANTSDDRYAQQARDILRDLAAVDKPDPTVLLALGTRMDQDHNWKAAADNYRRVLSTQTSNSPMLNVLAQNNLAMALARIGAADEGMTYIDAALQAMPKTAELYDTRAFIRVQGGYVDLALADIRSAIRLEPAQPRFRLRLVQMLVDAKQERDAARELKGLNQVLYDTRALSAEQAKQLKLLRDRLSGVAVAN